MLFLRFLRELTLPHVSSRRLCAEKHRGALVTQNTLPPNEGDLCSRLVCTFATFFELVFYMTASGACQVSRVFSAFMRKATHISAGEDSVLQTEKTEKNGADFGHFLGKSSFPMTATLGKDDSATHSNAGG